MPSKVGGTRVGAATLLARSVILLSPTSSFRWNKRLASYDSNVSLERDPGGLAPFGEQDWKLESALPVNWRRVVVISCWRPTFRWLVRDVCGGRLKPGLQRKGERSKRTLGDVNCSQVDPAYRIERRCRLSEVTVN